MKQFLKNYGVFLAIFVVVFTAIGVALLNIDKADFHLWLNGCHSQAGDIFFRYYTHIAEYGIYIVAFFLLFWKSGASIYLLLSEGVGALIVQIIKHIVRAPRPKVFFDLQNNPDAFPVVEGVRLHSSNSFPSGHSCTFFVLFFCLAIVIIYYTDIKKAGKTLLQIGCFLLALAGAYSRVYLSQHFALDIFTGGIAGVLTVCMLYPAFVWFNNKFPKVCAWHIALPKRRKEPDKAE